MAGGVPHDVQRFIADNIDSAAQLEVLLLLRGEPDREWSAADVSRALVSTPQSAALRLADLDDRRLLARSDGPDGPCYRYAPGGAQADRTIAALAEAYAKRKTAVIRLIFSRPSERVTSFADAFRIRRDD